MNSKLINICLTQQQADFSAAAFNAAGYGNITEQQIKDCTISEITGAAAPFTTTPVKYYDDGAGQLWIVTADVP